MDYYHISAQELGQGAKQDEMINLSGGDVPPQRLEAAEG